MTLLEAIQRDIEEAPTIMSLSDEQEFCGRLMEIPKVDLLEQGERMGIILDRLHESHTSVVFEVTSENDFRFFGDWLGHSPASSQTFLSRPQWSH